jgi:hypothetical protein
MNTYFKPVPMPTEEELAAHSAWIASRKVDSFALFPPDIKARIQPAIDELISLSIQDADLSGSFARGDYCMNEDDVAFKTIALKWAQISDVDVVIYDKEFTPPVLSDYFTLERSQGMRNKNLIPIIRDGKIV